MRFCRCHASYRNLYITHISVFSHSNQILHSPSLPHSYHPHVTQLLLTLPFSRFAPLPSPTHLHHSHLHHSHLHHSHLHHSHLHPLPHGHTSTSIHSHIWPSHYTLTPSIVMRPPRGLLTIMRTQRRQSMSPGTNSFISLRRIWWACISTCKYASYIHGLDTHLQNWPCTW